MATSQTSFNANSHMTENANGDAPFMTKPSIKRRHDLDALRAIAMLLGIILHAALSFTSIPWTVNDSQQNEIFYYLFAAIHGFRMPLFFLISGFFTAMLWRKRGLGGLIRQRIQRILLPLLIGCLTIVPAMWAVSYLASQTPSTGNDATAIFDAAAAGETQIVKEAITSNSIEVSDLHPTTGSSLVTIATFYGRAETVEMLLNTGADPNLKNADGGTPLHVAIFMGRAEPTRLLLEAGADQDAKDANGQTPLDNLNVDFGTTNFIAQMYGVTLKQDELTQGRNEIAKLLGQEVTKSSASDSPAINWQGLYGLFFLLPVFMHLWFLAFLCWLVVGFVVYGLIFKRAKFSALPKWLFCSPLSWLWLVPLTMLPQLFMMPSSYGPDPSIGLLPIPSVLAYYAIFFFVGAIYWDLDDQNGMMGRWWYLTLPLAILVLFPIGFDLVTGRLGWLPAEFGGSMRAIWGNFCQSLFVWMMIFGSIGAFRALLSKESKTMRYISDSSYWLYLAHLPLIILAQWVVKDWPIPAMIKFIGITVVVSALLLVAYEYMIRYTFIGTILNGRKVRSNATS